MSGLGLATAIVAILGLGVACSVLGWHVRHTDRRIAALEDDLRTLAARVDGVGSDARAAAVTAKRAAAAAGVDDPPRVPLEPVTGKVVRAIAFSAGARRALARLAAPRLRRRSSVA